MIDLTTSADFFRRSSLGILIGILILVVTITVYMFRSDIKNAVAPPKPPPATVAFGILPKFDLGVGYPASSNVKYILQTVTGELPALPNTAKVFTTTVKEPSFGGPAIAKQKAARLGFLDDSIESTAVQMKFIDARNDQKTLTINMSTGDLILTTNYLSTPEVLTSRPRSVDDAKLLAADFFRTAGLNFDDFAKDRVQTRNFRIDGGVLIEANSLSSTNVIEVAYKYADIDKLPIINAKQRENNVFAIVGESGVVQARIINLNLLKNQFATYPLKGVVKAFAELAAGQAAYDSQFDGDSLTVTSVNLGYVDSSQESNYLQPAYIFNTTDGVSAYVSAVDNSWTKD